MKRIELTGRTSPHFIGSWNINNDDLCKNIIDFFKNNSVLQKGVTTGNTVNEEVKTTDM